jgi:hypothetical protein
MLHIDNAQNEYANDFADTAEMGVLARGDVYDGQRGVGFYFARWFPARLSAIELLVVLRVSDDATHDCSLAFRASKHGRLELVDPSNIWMDWTPHANALTASEAIQIYPDAYQRAVEIVRCVLREEGAVHTHLQEIESNQQANPGD